MWFDRSRHPDATVRRTKVFTGIAVAYFVWTAVIVSAGFGQQAAEGVTWKRVPNDTPYRYALVYHTAPSFTVTDLQGKSISLDRIRGRVVVMTFFSPTCSSCVEAIDAMNRVLQMFAGENVTFINITFKSPADLYQLFRTKPMDGVVVASQNSVFKSYGIRDLPTHLIIDTSGEIVWAFLGTTPNIGSRIADQINLQLGNAR